MTILYEEFDTARKYTTFPEVPLFITRNLRYKLRDYQNKALSNLMFYTDSYKQAKHPTHLLFNMATGSGKTLVMAGAILALYRQGYRNFIFFVRRKNIVNKTRDNFLPSLNSSKLQFNSQIEIDGKQIQVKEVESFQSTNADDINIIFTTTQALHQNVAGFAKEGVISYDDLSLGKIALIADEAHSNQGNTKVGKTEQEEESHWETTINSILKADKSNILLEFTATIDLKNESILEKYQDKLLVKYDLKQFRLDKYSKDLFVYHTETKSVWDIMLQAVIISQFRKYIAADAGISLKPVVMFKAQGKSDKDTQNAGGKTPTEASLEAMTEFLEKIPGLTEKEIKKHFKIAGGGEIWGKASEYFSSKIPCLIEELKQDFAEQNVLIFDGSNKVRKDAEKLVNTLEEPTNNIRAIFAVDKLNEGWDVLNLFDIVRLYDKQGMGGKNKGKVDKTTISEQQLIGRGARYFPFVVDDLAQKFTRKYDDDLENPLRVIEQMHYHCIHNDRYISELKKALIDSGIMQSEVTRKRVTIKLKDEFKKTDLYQSGVVWKNELIDKKQVYGDEENAPTDENNPFVYNQQPLEIKIQSGSGHETSVFGEGAEADNGESVELSTKEYTLGDIASDNILRTAIDINRKYVYKTIENFHPQYRSTYGFLQAMKARKLRITAPTSHLDNWSQKQKVDFALEVLRDFEGEFSKGVEVEKIGSRKLTHSKFSETFPAEKSLEFAITDDSDKEFGEPQKDSRKYKVDLSSSGWYAYDENYGTSEEKSLVVHINSMIDDLKDNFDNIYLVRNDNAVRLYSFNDGRAFQPDFLLFMTSKTGDPVNYQLFIEPKGSQFMDSDGGFRNSKEGWKEELLTSFDFHTGQQNSLLEFEDKKFSVVGLPFYNESIVNEEDGFDAMFYGVINENASKNNIGEDL